MALMAVLLVVGFLAYTGKLSPKSEDDSARVVSHHDGIALVNQVQNPKYENTSVLPM
jgi:hypothetical protein